MDPTDLPDDAPFWLIDGRPCALDRTQPRPRPGEAETYTLGFHPDRRVTDDHVGDYLAVRDRARHANTVSVSTTLDDEVVYSSEVVGYDPLVRVEPGPYDPTGTPVWGLFTDVDDNTTRAAAIAVIDVELTFIAERGDYRDKAAVRAAHERRGFH